MLKIGVYGCGAIGTELCKTIDEGNINVELYAIYDRTNEHVTRLKEQLENTDPLVLDIVEMAKRADLVVECASQQAVYDIVPTALRAKCDVMIISVGAFVDQELLRDTQELARENRCRIYLPSGAISGLDGLRSAASAEIYSVTLTTYKHPRGLSGAPYIIQNDIDIDVITEKTTIFEGTAMEAIKAFPANVNVAATLSIAGIGFEKTRVKIIANPALDRNIHEISVEGDFGAFTARMENVPSPTNPKTSYLAALSVITTLKEITNPIHVGT